MGEIGGVMGLYGPWAAGRDYPCHAVRTHDCPEKRTGARKARHELHHRVIENHREHREM